MAADFELYLAGEGSCQVWKLYKQGTLVGHFYLEDVRPAFKQDEMIVRNKFHELVGRVNYNAHYGLSFKVTMYPDSSNGNPTYDIRDYFKLLAPTARMETMDQENIDE
jgi:hypothetical protein